MIRFTLGRVFVNKTLRYLAPILNAYAEKELNCFYIVRGAILAYTIGDEEYKRIKGYSDADNLLFVVIDGNGSFDARKGLYKSKPLGGRNLNSFLKEFRSSPFYYDDYPFGSMDDNKHVAVVRIPDRWSRSYKNFLKGKYSHMYTEKDMDLCMFAPKIGGMVSTVYQVLTKDPAYEQDYIGKVKEFYRTSTIPDVIEEYDLPPFPRYEILNYQLKTNHYGKEESAHRTTKR